MARKPQAAAAAVEEVEVLEEMEGTTIGIDVGVIIGTTLCLLTAIVFIVLALKDQYQAGPFA
jgi:hypothetical protein